MEADVDLGSIRQLFADIRDAFPHLRMLPDDDPHLDLGIHLPPQPGLQFPVAINLQGDELHLTAGRGFWVEWFPCTKPEVVRQFRDAVHGLLSGRYRVVESYLFGRIIKAQLQRPKGTGWARVATWAKLHLPIPWPRTHRILQNLQ